MYYQERGGTYTVSEEYIRSDFAHRLRDLALACFANDEFQNERDMALDEDYMLQI